MIKIENLTKDYGNIKALLGVSLDIEKAETFAIVGPNGAGKTTLLNTIVGLYIQVVEKSQLIILRLVKIQKR